MSMKSENVCHISDVENIDYFVCKNINHYNEKCFRILIGYIFGLRLGLGWFPEVYKVRCLLVGV